MEDVINGKSRKDLLQDYIKRKHQLKENMKRNSIKKKSTVPSRIQVKKGKESFKGFSTKPKATKSTFFAELDRKIEEAKFLAKHSVAGARQVFQDIPENLSEANYTTVYWVALAKFEEVGRFTNSMHLIFIAFTCRIVGIFDKLNVCSKRRRFSLIKSAIETS